MPPACKNCGWYALDVDGVKGTYKCPKCGWTGKKEIINGGSKRGIESDSPPGKELRGDGGESGSGGAGEL